MINQVGPWGGTLLSVALISALPLLVTWVMARRESLLRAWLPQLTAFGAGAVLGAAVLHIIPESLEEATAWWHVVALVIAGFVAFYLVEKALAGHDHAHAHGVPLGAPSAHNSDSSASECQHLDGEKHKHSKGFVLITFLGDAIHNIVDGMIIAVGFLTDTSIGFLTLLAVAIHELPREVGTFSLFVHGGIKPMKAVTYNIITAVLAMAGAAATLLLGSSFANLSQWLLPFAAGTYLYIALVVGRSSLESLSKGAPERISRLKWGSAGLALMAASFLI